jgi:serine/threonine-protein kinase RsbW
MSGVAGSSVEARVGGAGVGAARIVLRAEPLAVRCALCDLVGQMTELSLDTEELGTVELVVAEVLNNIAEHAYRGRAAGEIRIDWTAGATGRHLRITDDGDPMPGGRLPAGRAPIGWDHEASVPEGGFGWSLISALARNIVYRRDRGQNVLTFRLAVGIR